jgi:thioredoxin 1
VNGHTAGVREVSDSDFEREVLQADRPVIVDFWAPRCRPCRAIEPVLRELEDEHDDVEFVKLNIDENVETASRYGILSIPTVMLFADGHPHETVRGARPRPHFERAFARWLAAD